MLMIGQYWYFKLVHFLWTLVEELLKEVDSLSVSLLHSASSVSEVLEITLGVLDLM